MRSGVTEELVAMQVECEPLEEPADVEDPVAPPLERLHAVVKPLNKPARTWGPSRQFRESLNSQ